MKKTIITLLVLTVTVLCGFFSINVFAGEYDSWYKDYNWSRNSCFSADYNNVYKESDYSIKIDNKDYNDAYVSRKFKVEPYSKYKFSAMVKVEGYKLDREASSNSGASIGKAFSYDHSDFVVKNKWTKVEYVFETKNETEITLCLRNGMYSSCCKGTAYFSDIRLEMETGKLTNQWNILAVVFKNVEADVVQNGQEYTYMDSLNNADVNYLTKVLDNLYVSFDSISGGLMGVKTIDVVSVNVPVTKLGRYGTGYMIDPGQEETIELIKPYLKEKQYNQIIAISPISGLADGWAGLGAGRCCGINFCQINYSSGNPYPGNIEHFPDAIFVHEILHCIERSSREINPEKTPDLHSNAQFGYTDGSDEWRKWYTAYMRAELSGGKGIDPSVYWVYNSGKYKLVSDDMTVDNNISFERKTDNEKEETDAEIISMVITLRKGSKINLGVVLDHSSTEKIKWTSSNKKIASVTSKGKVTAKKAGKATITAKLGNSCMEIVIKVV